MNHPGSGARQFQNLLERTHSVKVKVERTSLPGGPLTRGAAALGSAVLRGAGGAAGLPAAPGLGPQPRGGKYAAALTARRGGGGAAGRGGGAGRRARMRRR